MARCDFLPAAADANNNAGACEKPGFAGRRKRDDSIRMYAKNETLIKPRHRERCLLFRLSTFREGEQQRVTLPFNQLLSDGEDAHITTRLAFQPACFTATHLPKHAPAPYFRSTTLHCNYSTSKNSLHYRPMNLANQRFRCVFICQMDDDA